LTLDLRSLKGKHFHIRTVIKNFEVYFRKDAKLMSPEQNRELMSVETL